MLYVIFMKKKRSSRHNQVTIELADMKLVDIPPAQNLVFFAAKQGRERVESDKYPIEKTTVNFTKPFLFSYEFPKTPKGRRTDPLRISFRLEHQASFSGFKRYGIVELDLTQCYLEDATKIRVLLSECAYNTYLVCELRFPNGPPYNELIRVFSSLDDISMSISEGSEASAYQSITTQPSIASVSTGSSTGAMSLAEMTMSSMNLAKNLTASVSAKGSQAMLAEVSRSLSGQSGQSGQSGSTTSGGLRNPIYETSPVKIPYERFLELEKQVNELLAPIINNQDEVTM